MTVLSTETKSLILSSYKPPYDNAVIGIDCEGTSSGAVVSKARCSVREDHYIQPTGHLNAVTWQIVLNQIAYLSFAYLCQTGRLMNAGEPLSVEQFLALRDHCLIRRTQMEFEQTISPENFVTEAHLFRMRDSAFWEMKAYIKSEARLAAEASIILTLDPRYRVKV